MFKLVIQDDEGKTTVVPLIRDEITIGRKEGNTIRLTERNVSRRHARILRSNNEVQIEDLNSYNGIRVNNARIAERVSLRLSDQVQIGDYKLYLKAEGVEQVDEQRTMPIERVENGAATEVMAAVQTAPTQPVVQPVSTPPPPVAPVASGTAQNRAISGNAETDPAGRPVATAAQVAALTAPAAYGKLVVVSSNYAGKEFDLTRPQMIIGRTGENDIVLDHRSISRNHAKVTRDPDGGRYTISDLQSSNGVRVNGQDYNKVELRRADIVDLGHVRMRFVEPGEDFVFARDAEITDVPEGGGGKGKMIAIVLAVLVLGGVGAMFAMKGGGEKDKAEPTKHGAVDVAGGSQVASGNAVASGAGGPGPGSNPATNPGSGATVAVATATPDAATAAVAQPNPADDAERIRGECLGYKADKHWPELSECANRLAKVDAALSKQLKAVSASESKAMFAFQGVQEAAGEGNLIKARKLLDQIGEDSTYRQTAKDAYQAADDKFTTSVKESAQALKRRNDCAGIAKLIAQAHEQSAAAADAIRGMKCEATAANEHPSGGDHVQKPNGTGTGSGTTATPPPANCDAEALVQKGDDNNSLGQYGAALMSYEGALKCRGADAHILQLAFMASCNSKNAAKAKVYFNKLSPAIQPRLSQICIRQGIQLDQLK